ncbi:Pentatricopeptide repeat-containing protein, mitochondrial [Vitis vinifera]|uniref:Pentatricopeptide repeat-containing protein, mitochondrial n=1 Tax=Vitis vinifera TaxID=29760 RepID=A0A438EL41_VITVI|nr:Pentatricopeptide repeat-containing protein, mitochondrial [Vitis vinifera]
MKAISKLKGMKPPLRYVADPSPLVNEFANFCHQWDLHRAMRAMDAMERHGVFADAITYSELIKCCSARGAVQEGKRVHEHIFCKGYEPKMFVVNTLLNMFVKFNLLEEAEDLFDEMPERNVVSWTTMISAYSNKLNDKALKCLILMLEKLHCGIIKTGLESDVFVRSALIDVYSKWSDLDNALGVFDEMPTRDLVVWNSIIGGFAQNSDGNEALNLFKRMKRAGFLADQATLTSVLRACTGLALLELGRQLGGCKLCVFSYGRERCDILEHNGCSHAGLVEKGWYYFRSMKKLFGVDPGREHYGCLIDLLGRAGRLDEAVKLIHEMECEPDSVTWRTLLGACRVHRNVDLAIYAAKKIIELEPEDAGTYILLSNIYANTQRWEDVAEVRKTMTNRESGKPQDLEGEQKEDSLRYHSEKLAIMFGLMNLSREKTVRIRKNLRICGDCHVFAKVVSRMEHRSIVIRDPHPVPSFSRWSLLLWGLLVAEDAEHELAKGNSFVDGYDHPLAELILDLILGH